MDLQFQNELNQYAKKRKTRKKWLTVVASLCAVVALGTSYALINPAATQQQETYCGYEEHKEHTDDCYDKNLICHFAEDGHTHFESCYEEKTVLSCLISETNGHAHSDSCYGTEEYYSCGLEKTDGHQHSADCYRTETVLICDNDSEGHEHSDECYAESSTLVCGLTETQAHQHDETCISTRQILICGTDEVPEHHHSDSCYETKEVCTCGFEEGDAHQHSEECYEIISELFHCELPIHTHTLQCFSNPAADVETAAVWERTFERVELSGNWSEDVLAIAQTQLGYTESTANYKVDEDGTSIKGYTRYGAWYGDPYGDWCAMFVSFCLNYAEVDRELMPIESACQRWVELLSTEDYNLYHPVGTYEPVPGDLIFFDGDEFDPEHPENRRADHVGLIHEIVYDEQSGEITALKTIEGNNGDVVNRFTYDIYAKNIMGFGELPQNPFAPTVGTPFAIPECTCTSGSQPIIAHSDDCELKVFAKSVADDRTAAEIYAVWSQLSEDIQSFVLEYLSWVDQNKLATLNDLIASAPIEAAASDGDISVAITGVFHADAAASLQTLDDSKNELIKNYIEETIGSIGGGIFSGAVDIGLYKDGEKLDLNGETVSVTVSGFDFGGLWGDELLVKAYHLKDTDAADLEILGETEPEIELLPASVDENGNIVFTTDGFSVIYFTVDFHYLEKTYHLPSGESMLLSELFAVLGLDFDPALIESVEFSSPELLDVIPVYGEDGVSIIDWELGTTIPFNSLETLTVHFLNGQVLIIDVTDAVGDTYLQKITNVDDLVPNAQYLIVYENTNTKSALTYRDDNGHRTDVTIIADGTLFTSANISGSMKWTLTDNYGLRNVGSNSYYLNLSNNYFFNTTDRKMVFTYNNGTFTINRQGGNNLYYSNNAFSASSNDSTGFVIYKIVDPPTNTYWVPVSEITDTSANYLIVNRTSNYAVGLNAYNTPANMTPVEGYTGVYSTMLDDQYWWKFSAAGNSSYQTNVSNPSYGIRLNNDNYSDPVGTDMTANTLTYNGDYWTMSNGTNYLRYYNGGGRVTSSTDTNNTERRATDIYMQVDLSDPEYGGDVPLPPSSPSFDTAFEHNKYIDAFRDNAANPDTDLDDRIRSNQLPEGDNAFDLYRLYLDMTGKQEPMDLLIVVDGSGSMDKTDMEGGIARDTAITKFLNGSETGVDSNGFLSYFLDLNEENQVSVVQFYGVQTASTNSITNNRYSYTGDSKVLRNWTHSKVFVDCANQYNNGTNYEAGLKLATEQFKSAPYQENGHRKIMIFMSDGVPTYFQIDNSDVGVNANYYPSLQTGDVGKRWGTGSYTTQNNYLYCKNPTKRAFDEFMAANPDVMVFTVGVSKDISETSQSESQSPEVLQYMADNGHGQFFSVESNMNDLKLRLESIFYPAAVTITDYLSKYVNYYDADPDVLVTMTKKSDGTVTKLYENGAPTAAAQGILSRVIYTPINNSEDYTGMVKAIFETNYKFEPDYTYTLSFNVKTTQTAYNDYATNIAGGQDAYGGVTGDVGTDYPGNSTSSEKPGFHSNGYADVTYVVSNVSMREKYDDPVIQVKETQIDVEKIWSDGADKHEADEIVAELYMVNGTTKTPISTVKLNKGNDWKATFTNLPSGTNSYEVIEQNVPDDYEVSYSKTDATETANEKWTITNARKTVDIKILKVDMNKEAIENNSAEFEMYTDEDLKPEHLLGKYTTGNDGYTDFITVELNKDYYLVETKAPETYQKMTGHAKFKVIYNSDNEYEIVNESLQNQNFSIVENQLVLMVMNPGSYELPETGGVGTTPIYTLSALLMAGAIISGCKLRRKRERRAE